MRVMNFSISFFQNVLSVMQLVHYQKLITTVHVILPNVWYNDVHDMKLQR